VIEAMNGARFVHDTLELAGWDVEIADAQKVKGLAPLACKTDRIDAWVLAELSRRDLVPAIWLPDPAVRAHRERARFRLHLVQHRLVGFEIERRERPDLEPAVLLDLGDLPAAIGAQFARPDALVIDIDGDAVSGIIDFHQADYAARALDLAVAVERNCFFWNRISAGDDDAYDLGHVAALVGAYQAVAPLTAAERDAFADVLQACQFEYGISFLDYYWGIERDRDKADWAWHTFVIGHARWWQSDAGLRARAELDQICSRLA